MVENEDIMFLHEIEKQLAINIPEVSAIYGGKNGFKITNNYITELSIISANCQNTLGLIFRLHKLEKLVLNETELTSIPSDIYNLTKLSELSLKQNLLEYIPDEIYELPELRSLNLNNNKLTFFITKEGQLPLLRTLELENNDLRKVFFEENSGFLLQNLFLNNNKITELQIEHLINLMFVSAQFNLLTAIPNIKGLTKLNTLELDFNQITKLTICEDNLPFLTNFSVSYNKITSIDFSNCKLKHVSYFFFDGNPLDKTSQHLLKQYAKEKGLKTNFIIYK